MGKSYMTAEELCQAARAMVGKYTYDEVDCIRVITNPLTARGAKFAYTGSNWFARNEVSNLRRLTSQSQLRPGKALFRSREPSESGYDLPDRYMQGNSAYSAALGETDFHHIGLMLENGEIVDSNKDSKRDGPAISANWQAWEWVADIDVVDYGALGGTDTIGKGGETQMTIMVVNTGGNGGVNFRQGARKDAPLCFRNATIPDGTELEVQETKDGYSKVTYGGETGWVSGAYLSPKGTVITTPTGGGNTVEMVSVPRLTLEAMYNTMGNFLGKS